MECLNQTYVSVVLGLPLELRGSICTLLPISFSQSHDSTTNQATNGKRRHRRQPICSGVLACCVNTTPHTVTRLFHSIKARIIQRRHNLCVFDIFIGENSMSSR